MIAIFIGVRLVLICKTTDIVVLVCVFLVRSHVEHLFMCLLTICTP